MIWIKPRSLAPDLMQIIAARRATAYTEPETMGTWLKRIGWAWLLWLLFAQPLLACGSQEADEFCGPAPRCSAACCSEDFCYGSGCRECNQSGCSSGLCRPDFRPNPAAPATVTHYDLCCALLAQTEVPQSPITALQAMDGSLSRAMPLQGHDQPPVPPPRE